LDAAIWPFDGMNEHGLAVGMMAVPHAEDRADARRTTIGSLHAMRLILDGARTVDEAIALLQEYNVYFEGGPPLHYLIADAGGNSAIVEFIQGEMGILQSDAPWQVATNFLVSGHSTESARSQCWRYAQAETTLQQAGGLLSQAEAMDLLQDVSQRITMWSVVYGLTSGEVSVTMGRDYDRVHRFQLPMQDRPNTSAGAANCDPFPPLRECAQCATDLKASKLYP
jgi:choloylglycine hydrolase